MSHGNRKAEADRILYDCGLLERLAQIGEPHVIGSYRMDMMAWNDLDIDIENEAMSRERLYDLTGFILKRFSPDWYEAKEVIDDQGKRVWFHGFEFMLEGEKWNLDLWFFDRETIAQAEAYCDGIAAAADAAQRESIVRIKQELIAKGLYSFEKNSSMDVYKAVLEDGVRDTEQFLQLFEQRKKTTV